MERPFEIYGNIGAASRALLAETLNGTTTSIGAASRALPAEIDPRIDDKQIHGSTTNIGAASRALLAETLQCGGPTKGVGPCRPNSM
jgi:hypothetical protein